MSLGASFFLGGVKEEEARQRTLGMQERQVAIQEGQIAQKQQQDLLTSIQKVQTDAMGAVDQLLSNFDADGIPRNSPQVLKALEPIVTPVFITAKQAEEQGLTAGSQTFMAQIQAKLSAPTQEDIARQKGRVAGTEIVSEAETIAESVKGKTAADVLRETGKLPKDSAVQDRVAINAETGEQRQAYFDPIARQSFFQGTNEPVPDGWSVTSRSVAGTLEETGLTTKAKGILEENIINIDDSISNLESISQSFDPKFLEIPTKIGIGFLKAGAKLGVPLSAENKALVEEAGVFAQNAIEAINTTIRAITGAQMSEKEADRIRKQVADVENDDPVTFISKVRNGLQQSKLARARWMFMLKNGIEHDFKSKEDPPISLESMRRVISERESEIVKEMKMAIPGDDKASVERRRRLIVNQLKSEFGL